MTEPTPQTVQPGPNVYVQQAPPSETNGLGVASLVLGLVSLATVWIPLVGLIAWITAPLGLILGFMGMGKPVGRGVTIAGIVCSGIALVIALAWLLLFGAILSAAAAGA